MSRRLRRTGWLAGLGLAAMLATPGLLLAQSRGEDATRRPYRGLFGAGEAGGGTHSLVATASVFSGYDDNVLGAVTGRRSTAAVDRRLHGAGIYSGGSTGVTYRLAPGGDGARIEGISAAQASYYYTDRWRVVPHYHGGLQTRMPLGWGLVLASGYAATFSHYQRFQLFPDPAGGLDDEGWEAGDPDNELFQQRTLRHRADLSLSKALGRRSDVSLGYNARYVDILDRQTGSFLRQTAGLNVSHRVSAHATMNLGYGYTVGEARGTGERRELHNIQAGMQYSRALSISRRTSLGFSTGSGYVVREDLARAAPGPSSRFHLLGNVSLNHEMGRTWTATLAYNRRFLFREGFTDPFLADGLSAQLVGLLSRRLDVLAQGSWSLATYQGASGGRHRGDRATVQLRYALSRQLAAYARYVYYRYGFSEQIQLDPDFPAGMDRQGLRVGLSLSVPVL
jgi:hypothetical protein